MLTKKLSPESKQLSLKLMKKVIRALDKSTKYREIIEVKNISIVPKKAILKIGDRYFQVYRRNFKQRKLYVREGFI